VTALKRLPGWLLDQARYLYKRYPARVTSSAVAALIFVCAKTGIVVDKQTLGAAAAYALPILLGGQAIHAKVEPVAKVRKPAKLKAR
jgi:hypothetical protein